MKKTKKIISLLLCLTLLFGILPVASVFADTAHLAVTFENSYDSSTGKVYYQGSNDAWVEVTGNISNQSAVDAKAVKVVPSSGYSIANHTALRLDGQEVTEAKDALLTDNGYALTGNSTYEFTNVEFVSNNNNNPNPGNNFNGNVYFVWKDGDVVCKYQITGIPTDQPHNTHYVALSSVTDTSKNKSYKMGNSDYYFIWDDKITEVNDLDDFNKIGTDENFRREVAIDPCGAVNGSSTITTNGDRRFRLTIYDTASFEGIAFSSSKEAYTYFPDFWDMNFYNPTVDLTGSTADQPAVYESFISESTLHFSSAEHSVKTFTSVRALDVPSGAVTVTENTNQFDVVFNSNYYDHVTFEITTADDTKYYIMIARTSMQISDNFGPDMQEEAALICELYYADTQSCNDYEVYATLHKKDGSTEIKKAVLSQPQENGGKGLKKAHFTVGLGCTNPEDCEYIGADFNVIKKSADATQFGGAYSGSDAGTYYDIEQREVIY